MKLSSTQENLAKALGTAGRIVSSRTSLPVLSNVLLHAEKNRLRVAATNLEIGINYWIGCKVEQEGSVTVPARLLSEFVSNIPGGTLDISASENNLTVSAKNDQSHINGIAADEFPLIPDVDGDPIIKLPVTDIRDAIAEVLPAVALDETRPVLAGIYIYTEGQELILVATDSFRLGESRLKLKSKPKEELSILVPGRTMQELVRILGDSEGELAVHLADNQVLFRLDDIELVSRLIMEGNFPPYGQIIPKDHDTIAIIETTALARIAKTANLFARENGGGIRLEIQAEGEIRILSSASSVGDNVSSAECEVEGDDGEITLNARFLTDALATIKSKQVSLAISGKRDPCMIRPVTDDEDQPGYFHIIMPLRT